MPLLRVLVVDDSPLMREAICDVLQSIGGCLVAGEARDGLEALELVHSLRPDLVVMDLHMPRMGGLEAMRVLNGEEPSIRVILMTTVLEPAINEKALALGAIACVEKGRDLWDGLRALVSRPTNVCGKP